MSRLIPEIRVYSPTESAEKSTVASNTVDSECVLRKWSAMGSEMIEMDSKHTNATTTTTNAANANTSASNTTDGTQIWWENTFHMRNMNLMNFGGNACLSSRSSYRTSQAVSLHRARMGCITGTAKSLNILRQTLQHSINKEINEVIHKYLDKFFKPAIENIRNNNGINSVSDQHIQAVCRQILEEAKKMYFAGVPTRANSPVTAGYGNANSENLSDNENNPSNDCRIARNKRHKESDSDSESSSVNTLKPSVGRKKKVIHKHHTHSNSNNGSDKTVVKHTIHFHSKQTHTDGVKREGHKWDPSRLSTQTKFVLGSRANKALGFGTTRGRLYTKHADLFRYIGDAEDKQWLHDNHLMPPAGGRAYLLIKQDILDLINSDEYKSAPGVNADDMGEGFTVPENMIRKMQIVMQNMRNSDMSRKKIEGKLRNVTLNPIPSTASPSIAGDTSSASSCVDNSNQPSVETNRPESGAISPADELEMPSTDPSPFSIGASCFEGDVSPNDNQQISPIPSDVSPSLTDIQL